MKMIKLKISLLFLLVATIGVYNAKAQITVGSSNEPNPASMLDLKFYNPTNPTSATATGNATVDAKGGGGLGLPRVELVSLTTLQPFIAKDSNFTNNVKWRHTGLMVYNLATGTDFIPGIYVWDGEKWVRQGEGEKTKQFFYMPSCNIDLAGQTAGDTEYYYNLYDEYKRQFTNNTTNNPQFVSSDSSIPAVSSLKDNRVYNKEELIFVITYYDPDLLKSVSVDSNGKMSYKLLSTTLTAKSFLNVVFIVK
ncbi:MAG: hypothetical protein LBN74_05120 [Prevotella sp.]|jgi:hypothetical protein|nr:hypothetical protein [Prevotella sp.]